MHDHAHGHAHSHGHDHGEHERAFRFGTLFNLAFVIVEVIAGLLTGSMALLADAGHNAGDVLGLVVAWGADRVAQRPATARHTYGLQRATVIAALINGGLLLLATGGVAAEAIRRMFAPTPVSGPTIIGVALAGVVVNLGSAALFWGKRKDDLNMRIAFTHLAGDALVALGVVVAGVIMTFTGWWWLDPVAAIVVSLLIVVGTWSSLREAIDLLLDAVPGGIDPHEVRQFLGRLPGVREVHDVHIWALGTSETALTAHLVVDTGADDGAVLAAANTGLKADFRIGHATLQLEREGARAACTALHA